MKPFYLLLVFCSFAGILQSQNTKVKSGNPDNTSFVPPNRTCGTPAMSEDCDWITKIILDRAASKVPVQNQSAIYDIPVIVHIIHNGESVGSGTNLSVNQINSQFDVLNEDFRKTNADFNTAVPSVFQPSGADCEINWCKAMYDPNGNPLAEPGINRINRNSMGWNAPPYSAGYVDGTIKPNSIWDPSRYCNIWVCNLSGGLLGYATFPASSGLTCLSAPYGTATSDGIVVLYNAFGRVGNVASPYNRGRTTTHELGHWLGLRHIWGDANCGNDCCNDTPTQQSSYFGCPTFPQVSCSNGPNGAMFCNYMDYTDDACMAMFTNDQKTRMQTCMQNGTFRAPLATSTACSPPQALDAGIFLINVPNGTVCSTSFSPVVVLKNFGTNTLTSVTISYQVDANPAATFNWSGSLSYNQTATITLPAVTTTAGAHTFTACTSAPNAGTDLNINNDCRTSNFTVLTGGQALPFFQGFESATFPPSGWILDNPDAGMTWVRTTAAAKTGTASAMIDNYNYNANNENDDLITMPIDLTTQANPALFFHVAYRMYTNPTANPNYSDTLSVHASTDCGTTWTLLYKKFGNALATATPTYSTQAFVPTATQWRQEIITLSSLASSPNVMFRFRNTTDYENNLYLDDINITSNTSIEDISGSGLINLFPNPTHDKIFLNLDSQLGKLINLQIINVLGQEMGSVEFVHNNPDLVEMNLHLLESGIYFVKARFDTGKEFSKKLILEK
jgi:hypothetical protein